MPSIPETSIGSKFEWSKLPNEMKQMCTAKVDSWATRCLLRTVDYLTKEVVDLDKMNIYRLSLDFEMRQFDVRGFAAGTYQTKQGQLDAGLTESIKYIFKNSRIEDAWFSHVPEDFAETYLTGSVIKAKSVNLINSSNKCFQDILQSVDKNMIQSLYVDPGYGNEMDYTILSSPKYTGIKTYSIKTTNCWETVFLIATKFIASDDDVGCVLYLDCEHGEDVAEQFEDEFRAKLIEKSEKEPVDHYHGYCRIRTENPAKHLFLSFVHSFSENISLKVVPAAIPSVLL
ncbi:hypothetical protein CAEBREN_06027 [Caenorhabditis brenneri]|uniref:Uncharacterized protein n=1 Tax=Caenorhabditis brenneri TaxID=135651 RepID=G0P1H7_CAEBE|nr:hypothetical protein CAEBREN_06027 [Caenorhabditis brenneri]